MFILLGIFLYIIFFFSSRRRHTRYWRDWSSDVCSSDLGKGLGIVELRSWTSSLAVKKGSGTFCAKHPPGRSGKRCLTPFRRSATAACGLTLACATRERQAASGFCQDRKSVA